MNTKALESAIRAVDHAAQDLRTLMGDKTAFEREPLIEAAKRHGLAVHEADVNLCPTATAIYLHAFCPGTTQVVRRCCEAIASGLLRPTAA